MNVGKKEVALRKRVKRVLFERIVSSLSIFFDFALASMSREYLDMQ